MLLGIDVGTTGAKAAVFDQDGNQRGYGFEEYGILCERPGWAEQDAEAVWEITKRVIAQAVSQSGPDIAALSVSVQGDAVIPIGRDREALAAAQLGMDYRGTGEQRLCEELFGGRWLFGHTGMRAHPLNALVKILWIKNNRPALFERAWKFVTYADYMLGKLGSDEIVIDLTMASRTMAMNIHTMEWSDEVLNKLGVSKDKLATPVPSGRVVGRIRDGLADELGLPHGVLLVSGGHDQTCAALGAGIIRENMALDSHGTAEVISTAFKALKLDDVMYDSYYPCYIHTVPDMYFTFSLNHTGGILLKWFVEEFCHADAAETEKTGARLYELAISKAADGPSPVLVLPHFNGSGTPVCDLDSKGAILGLTMATTRHDIAKAIIESLSFEMRINLDRMKKAGIPVTQLRCVGGGARSPIGLQSKADITGLPVSTLRIREAACLGAAMLAGIAAGDYKSAVEAAGVVKTSDIYHPRQEMLKIYDSRYSIYSQIYDTIKNILHRI